MGLAFRARRKARQNVLRRGVLVLGLEREPALLTEVRRVVVRGSMAAGLLVLVEQAVVLDLIERIDTHAARLAPPDADDQLVDGLLLFGLRYLAEVIERLVAIGALLLLVVLENRVTELRVDGVGKIADV